MKLEPLDDEARKCLDFSKEVLELSNLLAEKFNAKNIQDIDLSPYQHLLGIVLNESRLYLESIIILCQNGLGDQSALILRTLFEIYVTIKFLKNHPEHVERYTEYDHYIRMKRVEDFDEIGIEIIESERKGNLTRNEIFNNGQKAKNQHGFRGRAWYPSEFNNIEKICKETGDNENYIYFYRYVCDRAHFNVISLNKHNYEDLSGKVQLNVDRTWGKENLRGASELMLTIYQFINQEFDLGITEKIDEYRKKLRSLLIKS